MIDREWLNAEAELMAAPLKAARAAVLHVVNHRIKCAAETARTQMMIQDQEERSAWLKKQARVEALQAERDGLNAKLKEAML